MTETLNYCTVVFDSLENGTLIIDENCIVWAWNKWLEINTGISSERIIGKNLEEFYPEVDYKGLQRKIRTTLRLSTPTFYDASLSNRFITIPRNKISSSLLNTMQLQVTISPYIPQMKRVMISIHDISDLHELKMTLQQKMAEIVRLNTILTQDRKRIEVLSITDPLTKLYNRQKFNEVLEMMLMRKHWSGENSFGMIIADVDYFKKVNDTYGHQVGDKVLIAVAQTLSQTIRTGDILARWGGEEFVVLVPDVNREKICFVAEKLRCAIEQMTISKIGTITASFGTSLFVHGDTDETLMYRSDLALYRAKKGGRNRVEFS